MEQQRPRIVAKVIKLNETHWIDIYAGGWIIASIWGKGKVEYVGDDPNLNATYRIDTIDTNDAFIFVDAIERKKEAVEPIKPVEPELVKL